MNPFTRLGLVLLCVLAGIPCSQSVAAEVPAPVPVPGPGGWNDSMQGEIRVVSNSRSTIEIGPWELLNGQSVAAWLTALELRAPRGGELISSEGVKPETVPGAYSVLRTARYGKRKGRSILYACAGDNDQVRLLTLDVTTGNLIDVVKGAMFGEKVCKADRGHRVTRSVPTPPAPKRQLTPHSKPLVQTNDLAKANALIPAGSRPKTAYAYLKKRWSGFPAQLTHTAHMLLEFPNGNLVNCAAWDPSQLQPTVSSVGRSVEDCELNTQPAKGKPLSGFAPGQTVNIKFGNVSADTYFAGGRMNGADLVMTHDGRIAIGNFAISTLREGQNSATSTRRSNGLVGRYYLNGHTISIATENGDVLHGFVGYRSDGLDVKFDHIYINGKHYWDRSK